MKYDFNNFCINTVANFTRCEIPDRSPDYVSFSGSAYWDLKDRVRRWSNHWGPDINSCCWYIDFNSGKFTDCICGECYYEDFRFIRSLYEMQTVQSGN